MSCRALAVVVAVALSVGVAQQIAPPDQPPIVLRSTAQEVLLDFIARDKHQKLVTDLDAGDIEVLEDGVTQVLRSFEYTGGRNQAAHKYEPLPARPPGAMAPTTLREINVVSLVFEALGQESRREATQAAREFLANSVEPNSYIGVFTFNHRLALLQQYTDDADLLNRAVNRALTGAYQQFAKDNEAELAKLNSLQNPDHFQPIRAGSAAERGPQVDGRFTDVERRMAQLSIAILTEQAGNQSIDALQRLIEVQAKLPGRKTIIYFSPGLIIPVEQPERFRAVISAANRANIAFYTVDPSGLDTASSVRLGQRTSAAIGVVTGDSGDKQANFKENLRTLATDTGGFAIFDTNDARVPLRHVMEEVRAHYEATYTPTSSNYDGHFRTIEVRVRKPGIRVQARRGYFALPYVSGTALAPFEFDALKALNRQPSPHSFDFHTVILLFRAGTEQTDCRVAFSVPTRALRFSEVGEKNLFRVHVAFLALVKDEHDQVVRKVSRDLVFQAPADKRAEFERGEVTVTLPLQVPPGRYHVEAVANDAEGGVASTRRIALLVPSSGSLSDLVLVRNLQPAEDRDLLDPLQFSGGRITPEVDGTFLKSDGGQEGVYFVLYPGSGADVRVAVTHDGKLVASARPNLPPAEIDGSVKVLSPIQFSTLDPGVYEVMVTAGTTSRTSVVEVR
jgi:VWFA-related protein